LEEECDSGDSEKLYKITYTLNLLPSISEPDDIDDFMNLCAAMDNEEQYPIFAA